MNGLELRVSLCVRIAAACWTGPLAAPRFLVSVGSKGFSHSVSHLESMATRISVCVDLKAVIGAGWDCPGGRGLGEQKIAEAGLPQFKIWFSPVTNIHESVLEGQDKNRI